jgi:hypothetical protein
MFVNRTSHPSTWCILVNRNIPSIYVIYICKQDIPS